MDVAPECCSFKGKILFTFRFFRLALQGMVVYERGMECEIATDAKTKELGETWGRYPCFLECAIPHECIVY